MDFELGGTLLICNAMLWGFAAMTLCHLKQLKKRIEYLEFLLGVQDEDEQ